MLNSKPLKVIVLGSAIVFFSLNCSTPLQTTQSTNDSQIISNNSFSEVRRGFSVPQDSIKPYVYWYWVSDNISREGITKDLEAMARVGIGEAFIGNIGLETNTYGTVKVLSKEWWELTRFAITEGQRVGVDIGIFNSPGWSQSGGPWVKPSEAMRYLVSSETVIDGGKSVSMKLPAFDKVAQDVAVIAFPAPAIREQTIADLKPSVTVSPAIQGAGLLVDKSFKTPFTFTNDVRKSGLTIDFNVKSDFTARSLVIYPDEIPFSAQAELQAFSNGSYRSVSKFKFDRSNPMISVGPDIYGPVSIAFPETSSKKFRLLFSNVTVPSDTMKRTGGLKEIILSSHPKLERYTERQMGKMFQIPDLAWGEYLWPNQVVSGSSEMFVSSNGVKDITKFLSKDGTLSWNPPAGKWMIRRVGLTPTGAKNAPASPEATGFEVDKMNKEYLKHHFDAYIGKLLRDMPAATRKSFKHVVIDSYEVGPQNWTEGFANDFMKKYGYNPISFLPVLQGTIVNSADESSRFLWDLRRLVADRVATDYAGGLRELSEANGLKLWLENYGHWGFPGEFLSYGGQTNDIAGEFWVEGTLGNVECRAASSAAHIYGKDRVFAESYTAQGKILERHPGYLKKRGDWSFTEGINHVLLHVYVHQAYEDRNPGMNAWFSTEFNRKNTWFEQSKNWIDYQRRCMFLLQQGKPVNDVCYFVGEDAPKLAGDRNPEIPKGYSYDYINAEVILNRISVKDGQLVLPDGMSYKMMVMPPLETITPELLSKIKELVNAGAVILGPKPSRSPSLRNFPAADAQVKALANEMWGNPAQVGGTSKAYGRGKILTGYNLEEALNIINVAKDLEFQNPNLLFTHRRKGDSDIYFVTNQSDEIQKADMTFRVKGKQPELWDATNGTTRKLPNYSFSETGTKIPLTFEPAQSYFIVFSDGATGPSSGDNFPKGNIVQELKSPWQVMFQPQKRGPEKPVQFVSLQDWSKSENDNIKHFSGTATYKTSFNNVKAAPGERTFIDLGDVKNMAIIKINGKQVGGLWTAPWKIDISNYVSNGKNTLEVEVVNLWVNRMVGDSKLPLEKRPTWLANNYFYPTQPLEPSGLLGPVTIQKVRY